MWPMPDTIPLDPGNLDDSVAPGDDFFRYANGRWLDANPVPPEYGSWGSFHEVQIRNEDLLHGLFEELGAGTSGDATATLAGRYFESGMDSGEISGAGIGPLREYLARIGALESLADLRELTAELHPYGVSMLFSLYVAPDFDDSDSNLLYIGQGGLGLPERDYYLRDDERSVEMRALYRAHVAAQLMNLGLTEKQANIDADSIVALETSFAGKSYTAAQLRDVDLTTNKVSREELEGLMPGFEFVRYLDAIGADAADFVNLDNPGFFTAIDEALAETSIETLRAYARWHLVRAVASSLPAAFEDEAFSFYGRALGGARQQKERWKRVLAAATREIGESVAKLYVDAAFSPEAKERCEQMVAGLVVAMRESIEQLTWMSDETRAEALAKLAGFAYKIGYPDKWKGTEGLEIDPGPWVTVRMSVRRFEFRREIAKLGAPVDPSEWAMPAHAVNAYYHPIRNEIVFPAGILQPPFFYAGADDAVNYGAIGTIIGHEITHGFDDQGSRFDADGHLRNWWTDTDRAEFERRADVVVGQFDGYAVADGLNINGRLTLGENIADLGGVSIALNALGRVDAADAERVDGFTPAQRFFLSFGTIWRQNYTDEYLRLLVNTDPHSPSMFRCNGALANSQAFAEAFGLEGEDPMMRSSEVRADIW